MTVCPSLTPSDQMRPFLDESAGGFVERLFEALEESRNARGNKGMGDKSRKRDLKVNNKPHAKFLPNNVVGRSL